MSRRARLAAAALLLAGLVAACVIYSRSRPQQYTASWFDVFDTVTIVTGYADSEEQWNAQMDALHADLLRCHQLFDIYNHYDDMTNLYDVNAGAGSAPVKVDAEIIELLLFGRDMYAATDGACNIAAGSVLSLWHDAREAAATAETATAAMLPGEAALENAAQHCDINAVLLDESACTVAFSDSALRLDVGAIAKGWAVEQCAEAAAARGLTSALLNVGGNLRAIGTKPGGSAWTAGVENPWAGSEGDRPTADPIATVQLADGESLVISGDYQRYFTVDGVRYHHLIDLATLQPARYMSSVAVHCQSSALGDALSTGLFCISVDEGQALAASLGGIDVMWLLPDGTTITTGGFELQE